MYFSLLNLICLLNRFGRVVLVFLSFEVCGFGYQFSRCSNRFVSNFWADFRSVTVVTYCYEGPCQAILEV